MKKSIAIIGAGAAGLASAVRLLKDGYNVDIYEKEKTVGGKMNRIEEKGFKFDVGPTIVMMPEVYREVFEYAGKNPDDYISMERLDPIYSLQYGINERYTVSSDLTKLTPFLESLSEKDAEGYFKYIYSTYKRYLIAKNYFIEKSFRSAKDFYNPEMLVKALQLKTFNNAYNEISKYVKDEKLRKMLSFQTLYIGISPHNGPSIYTIIPMIETIYGVWYIKGGMYSMAQGMAKLIKELGGNIYTDSPVEEIIINSGKATGIKTNGINKNYDYIIANSDFPYTMKNLIKDIKNKGKYTDKKIDNMDYSCSVFLMYLGINKKVHSAEVHNISFADDFEKNISDIFEGIDPKDPSVYVHVPSKIDPGMAPEGKESLYVLVPVPELKTRGKKWTQEDIKNYKKIVYNKMKSMKGFENTENFVEVEKIYTPNDFEEKFNAYNGATFGLAPTLMQSNYFRPHNKSSYTDNLYFCGSSVHPGAGVPIVLTSAKLAVSELEKDDRDSL